jgi:hypothetical protein
MSVRTASDEELHELCLQTLARHGNPHRGGTTGEAIASLFHSIRIAQRVAYAVGGDDQTISVPAMMFPTKATPQTPRIVMELSELYEHLSMLRHNVIDRHGDTWLPEAKVRLLDRLITCTAVKAAGF